MKRHLFLGLMPAFQLRAAEPIPTYLDPASGGQDYIGQSEYTNGWGGCYIMTDRILLSPRSAEIGNRPSRTLILQG